MKNKYVATKGAQFSKKKAQVYGTVLEKIKERDNGIVPQVVVNEARDKTSPLHDYFDWDDTKAAEKYRVEQARNLISHLDVVINYETGKTQKAFFNVSIPDNGGTKVVYVDVERALTDKDLRKQVLQNALEELVYWQKKYKEYSEFKGIVREITKVVVKIKKRK